MALPTVDDLLTLDYAHNGVPLVQVASKPGIDFQGMDLADNAQPMGWGAFNAAPPPSGGASLQIFVIT